jgi:uncharacterized membrane protein
MSREFREDNFINRSKENFGEGTFQYDKMKGTFVNMNTKISLKCVTHGVVFAVYPNNHLKTKGGGCPQCRSRNLSASHKNGSRAPSRKKQNEGLRVQCEGIKKDGLKCENKSQPDTRFCKIHSKRQAKETSMCEAIKPNGTKCTFNAQPGSSWCGKHQMYGQRQEDKRKGIKRCRVNGCNNIVQGKKACESCLEKDRVKDRERHENKRKAQNSARAQGYQIPCAVCSEPFPVTLVTSRGEPSTKCESCLEKQRRVEERRPSRDRKEQYRAYEARPERKESKKRWAEENPEKVTQGYKKYRARKKAEDPEGYLDKNAALQKAWREANPEKWKTIDMRHRNSARYLLGYYKWAAKSKGIPFELEDVEALDMFVDVCWYCGQLPLDKANGIDRLDSGGPYDRENTRPCCSMCNYSKGGLSVTRFVAQAARIVSHADPSQAETLEKLYDDVKYQSPCGVPFSQCRRGAQKRGIAFDLTKEEFEKLHGEVCYLCGTMPEGGCGIDREDNDHGYSTENSRPCCNLCNMMKRDESLSGFLNRCLRIAKTFLSQPIPEIGLVERKRMAKRISIHRDIKLTRREKAVIRAEVRGKMVDWPAVSTRVNFNKGSDEDIARLEQLALDTEQALEEARRQKILDGVEPSGKKTQADYQRAYRERKAAAEGRVLQRVGRPSKTAEEKLQKKRQRRSEANYERAYRERKAAAEGRELKPVGRPSKTAEEKRQRKTERQRERRAEKPQRRNQKQDVSPKKRGRPPKYATDEERKAARAAAQRERRVKQKLKAITQQQ